MKVRHVYQCEELFFERNVQQVIDEVLDDPEFRGKLIDIKYQVVGMISNREQYEKHIQAGEMDLDELNTCYYSALLMFK